ncbi:aldehyde dehydrogenase [Hypoxylon sp. FL1284]|nr:aldehyde dehydrogenase [Hypoxylon sp. FL1284]
MNSYPEFNLQDHSSFRGLKYPKFQHRVSLQPPTCNSPTRAVLGNMALSNGETPLEFTSFHNIIDGKPSRTQSTLCNPNPATLEELPQVPVSTIADVNKAVQAAQMAARPWATVLLKDRIAAIERFADALEAHLDSFAQMLTKEQGKPSTWARNEVNVCVMTLREFCKLPLPQDVVLEETPTRKVYSRYTPRGVVVGMVPWNFPLQTSFQKLAPAILTGNSFILKPSPHGPYCLLKVAELGQRFFPPGVLQALCGDDSLGPMLTEHPGIQLVSFTGSTRIGKKVMESCSKTMKRLTLELGGNDPAIVCADVDPVSVGTMIALIAFFNTGQICIAIKRVYVHEAVYDVVLATIVAFAQNAKIGLDEASFAGPLSNKPQFEVVKQLLASLESTGLTTFQTRNLPDVKGYFLPLTVVDNPPDNSPIVVEEQFGPILPVMKWSDEADVIRRANDTDTGLGASVWSRDMDQAQHIADQIEAGTVWINTHGEIGPKFPFAGLKESGFGLEMGAEGLKSFYNLQTMSAGTTCIFEAFLAPRS